MNLRLLGVVALIAVSFMSVSSQAGNKEGSPVVNFVGSNPNGFDYNVDLSGGGGVVSTERANPGSTLKWAGPGNFSFLTNTGYIIFKMRDSTQVVLGDATRSAIVLVRPAQCTAAEIANNNHGCCNPALPGTCSLQQVTTQMDSPALERVQQGNLQTIKSLRILCTKEQKPVKNVWTFNMQGDVTADCTLSYVYE